MKVQDLIDNAGSIIENGVENRAQFDEAMSLYGNLVQPPPPKSSLASLSKALAR